MPAPTNTDATTATDLGAFPATVTQDVNFGGTTYQVWYKFTATQTGVALVWAYGIIGGNNTTYQVELSAFIGPAASPVPWPDAGTSVVSGANRPVQFPVTSGVTYYLEIDSQFGNVSVANLTLTAEYFVASAVPAGSLIVPDDTPGFPWALLSATTAAPLQFKNDYPPGEAGVSEPSIGAVLVDDNTTTERKFKLYTSTLSFVASLAHPNAHGTSAGPDLGISFGRANHCFYAGWISSGTTMALRRLSPNDLTVQSSWTLSGVTNIRALAPNAAETVLYLSGKAGLTGSAISKYDLVGMTFLADFAATITNYVANDILVLSNDTVVVLYQKNSATKDLLLKTYDNAGSVLQSKSYGAAISTNSASRLTYALDDPTSFWLWIHNDDGTGTLKNVKASDLSDLASLTEYDYEDGVYQAAQTSSPVRSGNSQSCPFFVLRGSSPITQLFPIRRQRRCLLPSSPDNKVMRIPYLELLMRTGIGLMPGAATEPTVLGSDPQVMLRISKDGGKTWLPEQWRSAGEIGQYLTRVRWQRTPNAYRNAVVEITVSDPVDWQFLALMGTPVEGSS